MRTQFPDTAKRAFSFLDGMSFRLTHVDEGKLRFESVRAVVDILWDARSGELEVFLGLYPPTGLPQDSYSLTDILAMEGAPPSSGAMPPQVADENRLRPALDQLAADVLKHAQPALAGDRLFFRRLELFRGARAEEFGKGMKLRQVRAAVDDAWDKQDFGRVIALFATVADDLTEAEKLKLEYAKRHQTD